MCLMGTTIRTPACPLRSPSPSAGHLVIGPLFGKRLCSSPPPGPCQPDEQWCSSAAGKRWVVPYGDDNPYSCVPFALTKSIGRPPRDWPFIWQTALQLTASWALPA
uniref:Uncharacterized protein n=1 Tax=Pyrodinium bahamense TaxID=73915 RepID=A0A7S0FAR1_9DINO